MDADLIAAHRDVPALMPFLHLPVQSGSDRILAAMNRRHSVAEFRATIDALRAARPDLALSSDFIVGFPGETEVDFTATLALIRDVGFAQSFSFKYSSRPGTPAALAEDQVDRRCDGCKSSASRSSAGAPARPADPVQPGNDRSHAAGPVRETRGRHPGQQVGRTPYLQPVHADAPASILGAERAVRIVGEHAYILSGILVSEGKRYGRYDEGFRLTAAAARRAAECSPEHNIEPVFLEFEDNSLLPLLFGEHDRNLARIEQLLGVSITSRGNRVAISGPTGRRRRPPRTALLSLHKRVRKGMPMDMGEVDAAVRMSDISPDDARPFGDDLSIRTRRRIVEARSPTQRTYLEALRDYELVFGLGPAGTGKTYLAVAAAVDMLMTGQVSRIILSRPAVEAGERLGFLPGDLKDKVDPYLRPLYDALHDMLPGEQVLKRLGNGEIEVAPLAFMRGRTLSNAFVILDEAQNTTPTQMKMFLTRMGENSRMAVTGDLSQVDLPLGAKSGLRDAVETLDGIDGATFVRFTDADVVRHPMVTRIVRAYNAQDNRLAQPPGTGV